MASAKKRRTQTKKKAVATAKPTAPGPELVEEPAGAVVTDDVNLMTDLPQPTKYDRLYGWNKWLAWIHALQGIAILVLSANYLLPVSTSFITPNPLATKTMTPASHHLFDLSVAWLVALAFFAAAIMHCLLATVYRTRYESEIKRGVNRLRWIQFGVSGSLMAVAIGLLCGIYDFSTLLLVVASTLITSLLGMVLEMRAKDDASSVLYVVSGLAGIASWVVLALYLVGANVFGEGHLPAFVYWLAGSAVVLYGGFAANFYLARQKQGKWADYLYTERMYMLLSAAACTALAWQIFAGALKP
ncbi:MAG TPA: heliorhodopsin HeR [Candidatus Saccharimonadales bacterium]|nr:heliorhodopsin HeR [Candidatus Saccharimonadales bacterium]